MSDVFGDAIIQFLPQMRAPMRSDLIHSDESVLGFETPSSAGGLFIDLLTFQSVGLAHVEAYCQKYDDHRIFLRHRIPGDEENDSRDFWSIVIWPQKIEVELEEIDRNIECIPSLMSITIESIISATPALKRLENRFLNARESKKNDLNLAQYEPPLPIKLQPGNVKEKDWYCQVCGLKCDNLWLNVIDGTILCGRKYREGTVFLENDEFKPSEGHGHAYENFKQTNHALIVKISSISPFGLVIYNFAQDEFVDDPQMASHLAKIGVKTLERASHELQIWQKAEAPNENVRVSLSDTVRALTPDSDRIGIRNTETSNSALISAIQLLARCPAMRIYSSLTKHIFNQSENPVDDFNLQFGKIVSSLMDDDPRNWTSKQCSSLNLKMICHKLQMQLTDIDQVLDPVQLVSFLLKLISTELNPSPADKFAAELDTFTKCILSDAEAMNTTNSSVVEIQAGESISKALEDWATFTEHNFFSPQLRERSPAQIRRRFRSFPSKLLISCPRYFKDTEWVVKEVAQKLIVEDELDLSWLKSDGEIFQPTMELGEESENGPVCDEIRMLFEMGFSQKLARKALDRASWDVEGAAEWLLMNPEQEIPRVNHEISEKPSSATFSIENYEGELASEENPVFTKITLTRETRQFTEEEFEKRQREYTEFVFDPESVALLESFGIPTGLAKKALRICKGEIERSADWAFNNWDSPIYEDDLEEPLVTEESVTAQAKKVKDELNSLQREGQELMRQMAKEKRNPTTDFVTEMVDRLEGRKATSQSAIPRTIRPKKKLETPNETLAASASPTTQAMLELMDDLEIEPQLPKQENQISEIKEENAINNREYYSLDLDLTDQSTIHDVLVNENGCMEDTTDCNTTDYDTDYIVIDNLTDYHEQELTDSRSDEAIPLEELELLERPASESDRLSLIDELINESVQQIDKQIEENVTASSFENLKMSEDLRRSPSPPQIVDPLSVISEENSQLPTDFCTSPENSLKSECDDSQPTMTLSSVIKGQSISELGQEITKSSCTPSMETVLTPAVPEKKKKKKIIKKIVKKKVKRSTKENQNENANNSVENAKYSLVSFISRTDGTPMLPHFSYFEKSGENEWLVFDDGNVGICSEDRVAEAKSTAVLFLYDRLNEI